MKPASQLSLQNSTESRGILLPYRLHDILQRIEANVSSSVLHLRIHGQRKTLQRRGDDKRPFSTDQRQLDRA